MITRLHALAGELRMAASTWISSTPVGHRGSSTARRPASRRCQAVAVGDTGSVVVGMWAGTSPDTHIDPFADVQTRLRQVFTDAESGAEPQELLVTSILFRPSSHELEPCLRFELEHLARTLRRLPTLTVHLHGHADARGPRYRNHTLTERRIGSVCKLLTETGIDRAQIRVHAHGKLLANYAESDTDGRVFDRRVLLRCTLGENPHVQS